MFPYFGDEKRRNINLGGNSSVVSQAAILDAVKVKRDERNLQKRRQDNAIRIQAWWRGVSEARRARRSMICRFEADATGITGLRCLVFIKDPNVLAQWSSAMAVAGKETLYAPLLGPERDSWLVLIRQTSLLLLQSVVQNPLSSDALNHLNVLRTLLSPPQNDQASSPIAHVPTFILDYLLQHDLYQLISQAITAIPVESKTSPALPLLVSLSTAPFKINSPTTPPYSQALCLFITYILSIPLLPNRIPISSVTQLASEIPSNSFALVEPFLSHITSSLVDPQSKIHLIANLYMFISPRYQSLPQNALAAYLHLLIALLNQLPTLQFGLYANEKTTSRNKHSLLPPVAPSLPSSHADSDSDSDDNNNNAEGGTSDVRKTRVSIVSEFSSSSSKPSITTTIISSPPDARTWSRLGNLASAAHVSALLAATQAQGSRGMGAGVGVDVRGKLVAFLLVLKTVWPATRDGVMGCVVAYMGGGFLRELYRVFVRPAPIGKDGGVGIADPSLGPYWPPLLLLTDLYTHALLTMGDDEFFGTENSGSMAIRNPLSLDELTTFSRQLLNVAFTLFWKEGGDGASGGKEGVVPGDVKLTWEAVRDKATRCLLAIHARDSRRSFVPPGHWLVSPQIDIQSFVEAAVFEEQQLSQSNELSVSRRTMTKRQVAMMSPRLGILNNIPFSIPFEVRVSIFRHFVLSDMESHASMASRHSTVNQMGMDGFGFNGFGNNKKTRVQVRRGSVAQDGFDRLADSDLKDPIEIQFIDQFGQEEAGIDGGGVFKEFFTALCQEVFDTDRGLWLANVKNELYPNPHSYATESHSLNWYRFIGRILGKAMYEGILVDVAFAGFFLAKWLGRQSYLDDLASLDPELYNGLIFLKHRAENPEDLSLNFTVAVEDFGVAKSVELVPGGSNIAVTKENRLSYIYLVSHYRLSKQIKLQSEAFFEGLSEMIDPKWLRMFNQQEVQILLGGVNAPIDLEDLRQHTLYGGVYDENEETIVAFWKVVNTFNQEERRALLRFVTSCSRPPLLGFKELRPNFCIRDSGDPQRLPSSSTCVNLLKLPRYKSTSALRAKLLKAINSGAGFDLS